MKKNALILIILFFSCCLAFGCVQTENLSEEKKFAKIQFIDDSGKEVKMDGPAKKIISLYSAHTENLFALGLDEEIIGVGKSDAYPPRVRQKQIFDYRSDPEKVIAADPDLVLIRPFIKRSKPEFVEALEKANINVVCLYPENYEKFTPYIKKLALLTGKEEMAKELLSRFEKDIADINMLVQGIEPKVKVFFESTQTEYRTITPDSIPAHAINFAGGINIASDAKAMKEGTSIASYGAERILEKADEIDVYVAQSGAMNSGGSPHAIRIRPGFDAIKAVRKDRIFNINEKLVSSPTFRYAKGVKELARMFYPEILDDLSIFDNDDLVTREKMAQIAVMFKHKVIFTPSSKYYGKSHQGHVYGDFKDVDAKHPNFDYIETAVLSGFMDGYGNEFRPAEKLTREGLAEVLFMLTDLKEVEADISLKINDLNECKNPRKVEIVVGNGLMKLEGDFFKPSDFVTGKEVVEALEKIKK